MKTKKSLMQLSLITIAVMSYCSFASAQGDSSELDTINVNGSYSSEDVKQKKVGETVKTATELKKQQVQDSRDLVRYETGVSVVEAGRFGSSGYAIRGVDENRVAITVDGLRQSETLSSQGFKELFEGYGNFNNTRNSVEIETLKQATIVKGADSIKSGSGALGGSVIFETKDARDFLTEKNWHLGYKSGYFTGDNQRLNTFTAAGRYKWFDVLVIKTKRKGHELENYDYKNARDIIGKLREKTDPYTIEKDSTLVKLSFNPSDNHRFTIMSDLYENKSKGQDLSYSLQATKTQPDKENTSTRYTNDSSKRTNYSFSYENYSSNFLWDTLKLTYSEQKIRNRARTDDYCDDRTCKGPFDPINNPLGISLKDGKIVDKEGNPINLKAEKKSDGSGDYIYTIVDKNNMPYPFPQWNASTTQDTYFSKTRLSEFWFDCSIFDCKSDIEYFSLPNWSNPNLEKKSVGRKFVEYNGKTYSSAISSSYRDYIILPNSKGYIERYYQERDLNTKTKQLNLDLTKYFSLLNTEHSLQYGLSYSKSQKEMLNKAGFDAKDPQWWAKRFLGVKTDFYTNKENIITCETATGSDQWNGLLCPNEDKFSFLIPVVSKNKSIYLTDSIKVNDFVHFDLGYRYDRISYEPNYSSSSAPIPQDMIRELFIPYVAPYTPTPEPSWRDYAEWSDYTKARDEWRLKNEEGKKLNEQALKDNTQANLDYFSQNKKYKAHSYSLITSIDPTDYLKLQLKYSKGFRVPTSDEVYFTFKHPDFTILPNVNLKPEIAKTQELAFTFYGDYGFISTSFFRTKYDDFIDLKYIGTRNEQNIHGGVARAQDYILYQNVNRQDAKVTGFDINSTLHLGKLIKALDGVNISYKYTYQKGRIDGEPMNAIQPKTSIYGIGYVHKNDKFGVDLYVTHVGSKKAKDTYDMYAKDDLNRTDTHVKWRSNSYTMIDLIGYVKPIKNLTLQFGIYNLSNRKYLTWESARSIRPFGTSNLINQNTGQGINRFYSPGRNFKFNMEFVF